MNESQKARLTEKRRRNPPRPHEIRRDWDAAILENKEYDKKKKYPNTIEETKPSDYFEDIDLDTTGMSQGERIEEITRWGHSQELKSSLLEVTALRFHQQQHGLIPKEEYRILNGRMITFWYQPPSTNNLQIYDRYPLVLIIKRRADGFTGINFHYLGIRERAELLTFLRDRLDTSKKGSERLQIKYHMLLSKKRYKYFRPALKNYYKSNIKSRFIMIPEKNWDKALILPIEEFEGNVPLNRIWRESRLMANKESNRF